MSIINPIIVIAGATATGKTGVAVALAEKLGGEIISADSMQVYKYMDIGTAKPSKADMRGIHHYLIDEVYPDEPFNVAVFKKMAQDYLEKIRNNSKIAIVAGGTGFYINALVKNAEFPRAATSPDLRQYYEKLAEKAGREHVFNILAEKDRLSAEKIHPNNVKRVIRALEYFETTGSSIALHNESEKTKIVNKDVMIFTLHQDREKLYEAINKRVDIMINNGLKKEVESLLEMGYNDSLTSMQGIGYKEMIRHLNGEYSLEDAIAKIKQASRNYAKRQVTWFKHQLDGIPLDASLDACEICSFIYNELKRRQNVN